jgi:hemolysin activation/secretion protein
MKKNETPKPFSFLCFLKKTVVLAIICAVTSMYSEVALASESEDYKRLEKRLEAVEKQLAEQAKIIEAQQKMIDKIAGMAPEIKELITVPELTVNVEKFVLNGANLLGPADFDKVLSKYKGRELTLSQLNAVAEELSALYRSKGYVSSKVYLAEQEIDDNTVEFSVIEGRIGEIVVEGGKYVKPEMIEKQITLKEGEILDYEKLNRDIRRINLHPDITVQAVLEPGKEQGTSDVVVKMKEDERPWHLFAEYSNEGSKYTTKSRFGAGFVHNNFLGNRDILTFRGRMGERTDIYSLSTNYSTPLSLVGLYNTRVGGYYAYSNSVIGDEFRVLNPKGDATAWGIYLSHPWLDVDWVDPFPLTLQSTATVGFDSISTRNELLGQETSRDEIRVLKTGFSVDEKDEWGRTFISEQFRFGLDDFAGSMKRYDERSSRLDASSRFFKNTGDITRISRIPFSSYVVTSFKYQLASDPLPQSEQFVLGGAGTVRGYPENEYFGDYGYAATAELRTPAFIIPSQIKVPFDSKTALRDAIQFAYFIDGGRGILFKPRVGEEKDLYLVGGGFGIMWDLYGGLKGRIDFGFPINKAASDEEKSRIHMSVGYQ